ncbi:alanine aminotransferase 2-like isoform X1 [Mobula birostris]|uniref:alanine aminotransferase 2-like isoform X1 n=1 Tax=Mobula birostris TaxID=1983395 RepID=UPI003B284381
MSAPGPFMELLLRRGAEIRSQIEQGLKMPFTEVLELHTGDLQAMRQKPITFLRQVSAACTYSPLLNDPTLPSDVKQRARTILASCPGNSIGCYGEAGGILTVRNSVAKYLEQRDGGIPADPENIFLFNGTSRGLSFILKFLMATGNSERMGILVPVPSSLACQHIITLLGGAALPYQLDEQSGWTVWSEELRRVLEEGCGSCRPRVLYVVNPGSPTGHVMDRACMERIIRFAADEGLLLLADEGHPEDVYSGSLQLLSFKRVLHEMGPEFSSVVEFMSFNSVSKGHIGESGVQGCYMEVLNVDPTVLSHFRSMVATFVSCSLPAQIAMEVAANPPDPGDPSYPLFQAEKQESVGKLAAKSQLTEEMLNRVPGMHCAPIRSGIYAFPRIELPARAREVSAALGQPPDVFYCLRLLQDTGYLLAPGEEFGQKDGTAHFRMTFALPIKELTLALEKIVDFHQRFIAEFS